MTKATNYLVSVTETKTLVSTSYGQNTPANNDRIIISEATGSSTFGSVGGTPTFCLDDSSAILTNPDNKAPVYQDVVPRPYFGAISSPNIIAPNATYEQRLNFIPCTYSEFSYVIFTNNQGSSTTGSTTGTTTLTLQVTSNVLLQGTGLRWIYYDGQPAVNGVDYSVVAYNGNPAPFQIGYIQILLYKPWTSTKAYVFTFNAVYSGVPPFKISSFSLSGFDGCYGPISTTTTDFFVCSATTTTTTTQPPSNVSITTLNGLDVNSFTAYINGVADTGWKSGTRSYAAGTVIKIIYSSPACGVTRNGSAYTSNTNVTLSGGSAQSFSLNNANSWTNTGFVCIGNVYYTNQVNPCGGTQQVQTYPGSTCDCVCNQNCNGTYYGPNVCGGGVGLGNALIQYQYYSCNNNPTGNYQVIENCSCSCNQACNGTYQGQSYCSGNELRVDNYFSCNNAYESTTIISACSCDCNQACSGEYWGDPYCDGTGIQKRNRKYVCNNANTGQVETISTCSQACGAFVAPIWTPVGNPYCEGCYQKQDEVQSNVCCPDPPQGTPRTIELGVNSACGTWDLEYYCVGYDKWSRQRNSCTSATCCDTLVEVNSAYCGYVPPPACRTYQIVGDYTDESVTGIYTNCSGGSDSFSFFGGPGTVGYICALAGSVYVTSGNGSANDVGGC
jgi:hypothetical protein